MVPSPQPTSGDDANQSQWYAVWTRSRHEQVVCGQLEQKAIESFLPTIARWSRWKDRKKKIDWPLFPGYCFARFPAATRMEVLKCTGVVTIVSVDGAPAPIPAHQIDSIRQLVESDLAYDPCPLIHEGDQVEVTHGPLKGIVGRLVRKNDKARLLLSVDLIGQAVSVDVDAADVRPDRVAVPMKIGSVELASPLVVAPMAGMTDTAFRRLVKRNGGCGLVVTEMVSSEGLVRGIDRTLEYAEYTEEERPVSIQIFGGDPDTMAEAARIVEGMGADIVDVNMGCPVRKIARHNAGCSLMREPEHAADVIRAMTRAVSIPVTVKMRAGWSDASRNAPDLARRVQEAGAAAVTIHGRTAEQSYTGLADWDLVSRVAGDLEIPVFGSGDCVEPDQITTRLQSGVSGVLVGRGVLRNPWILAQADAMARGLPEPIVTLERRGQFLRDYLQLLLDERVSERDGFRHVAPGVDAAVVERAVGRERWVINKLKALCGWYSKGIEGGSEFRVRINSAASIRQVHDLIEAYFGSLVGAITQGGR